MKVAIQGIKGSFHYLAAIEYFNENIQTITCLSFDELIQRVNDNSCDYAVMAIENTIAGSILKNYKLLDENELCIVAEYNLKIQQNLIGMNSLEIKQINEIHSHPMAIYQCEKFLAELSAKIKIIETNDTALSVKQIKENNLKNVAAISSKFSAELYGLKVLKENIQDNEFNWTRFLIIKKGNILINKSSNKISIVVYLKHEQNSLLNTLNILSKYRMNLTKIQSLPIPYKKWQYKFYLDMEFNDRISLMNCIEQLKQSVERLKILGIYKSFKN
ncbi:MAG: prephenate dehydratase [Vicingaceae bacterium]